MRDRGTLGPTKPEHCCQGQACRESRRHGPGRSLREICYLEQQCLETLPCVFRLRIIQRAKVSAVPVPHAQNKTFGKKNVTHKPAITNYLNFISCLMYLLMMESRCLSVFNERARPETGLVNRRCNAFAISGKDAGSKGKAADFSSCTSSI